MQGIATFCGCQCSLSVATTERRRYKQIFWVSDTCQAATLQNQSPGRIKVKDSLAMLYGNGMLKIVVVSCFDGEPGKPSWAAVQGYRVS